MNCQKSSSVEQLVKTIDGLKKPSVLLIISGKRKCGKDFLVRLFREHFCQDLLTFSLSVPIKSTYARQHNLDFDQLLSDSPYKEHYRAQMVQWSDGLRALDPYCFHRLAITEAVARDGRASLGDGEEECNSSSSSSSKPIWLLTDARRPADMDYFADHSEIDMSRTRVVRIRISSTDATRSARGWIYTPGVDDQQTECALDGVQQHFWHWHLHNDGTKEELLAQVQPIFDQLLQVIADGQ